MKKKPTSLYEEQHSKYEESNHFCFNLWLGHHKEENIFLRCYWLRMGHTVTIWYYHSILMCCFSHCLCMYVWERDRWEREEIIFNASFLGNGLGPGHHISHRYAFFWVGGGGGRYMVHPGVQSISRLIIMFFLRD